MKAASRHVDQELGSYVLGALEPPETVRVEAHLQGCARCRAARDGYQEVADGLLYTLRPQAPPPGLRSQLRRRIQPARPRAAGRPSAYAVLSSALALAIVALAILTWQVQSSLHRVESRFEAAQAALDQRAQVDSVSLALLSYPSRQVAMVTGEHAYGTMLYEPRLPMAVLNAWGLPDLERDQVFQIWLRQPDGTRVSAGLFQRDDRSPFTRVLLEMSQSASNYVEMGVTIEPNGGSPAPTGPRVLHCDL
jgi:anti-sigma-K factor RskA